MELLRCALRRIAGCLALLTVAPASLFAHVELDSPIGGETFVAGSTVEIEWHPSIEHDTIDWDLWYSTVSDSGPWQVISEDLPVVSPAEGTPHLYDWLVPAIVDSTVWLRVRQDNDQHSDFYDESNSFSILAAADFDGNGQVNGADLQVWETGLGNSSNVSHADGDANLDGRVDSQDFIIWQRQTTASALSANIQAAPEPATLCLLLPGTIAIAYATRRRQR